MIYTGAERVFKTTDQGKTWKPISEDLTRNDKSKQQPSGGPLTLDITSVEYYNTVFALAESPKKQGTLWAGTDDGFVHLTTDEGQHWTNVSPKMPEATVSLIDPSFREQTAIKVGNQPMDMAFHGDELLVPCQGDGSVHVIDLPARKWKHSFQAGTGCESLAFF